MNTQQNDCGCGCGGDCQSYVAQLTPAEKQTCCSGTGVAAPNVTAAATSPRPITVEFLYLDLSVCTRCQGAEASLEATINQVAALLGQIGHRITVQKIHVQTEEQARQLNFVSSPTIRINGRDIQPDVVENHCDSCSDLCGSAVACRAWHYQGREYEVPPAGLIIDALLHEIYDSPAQTVRQPSPAAAGPDNLKTFFAAQPVSAGCGCGG